MEEVIDMVPGEKISLDHLGDIYYAMNRKRKHCSNFLQTS